MKDQKSALMSLMLIISQVQILQPPPPNFHKNMKLQYICANIVAAFD